MSNFKVINDFLHRHTFESLQDYCGYQKFWRVPVGDKEFSALPTPEYIIPFLEQPGHSIILTFIRKAHADFDTDYRIHADGIIAGQKADIASVLYINDPDGVTENGTAFWEHKVHGQRLPENFTEEEFDRLLTEEANDLENWKKLSVVQAVPNRLLVYDANLFHSKHPNHIKEGRRVVLVTFFKKN